MSRSTSPNYFIYGVILVALYILYKNKNGTGISNIFNSNTNTNTNQVQDTSPKAAII